MERVRDLLDPALLERTEKLARRSSIGSGRKSMGGSTSGGGGGDHLDSSYKNNLPITEDANGVPGVPGAESVYVSTPDEIYDLLSRGNGGRATSSTNMNEQSSRSHAVFILTVEQQHPKFSKKGVRREIIDFFFFYFAINYYSFLFLFICTNLIENLLNIFNSCFFFSLFFSRYYI